MFIYAAKSLRTTPADPAAFNYYLSSVVHREHFHWIRKRTLVYVIANWSSAAIMEKCGCYKSAFWVNSEPCRCRWELSVSGCSFNGFPEVTSGTNYDRFTKWSNWLVFDTSCPEISYDTNITPLTTSFDRFASFHSIALLLGTIRVTFDGNIFISPKAVQKGFCRLITQLLLGTGPSYSSICSPGNILLQCNLYFSTQRATVL